MIFSTNMKPRGGGEPGDKANHSLVSVIVLHAREAGREGSGRYLLCLQKATASSNQVPYTLNHINRPFGYSEPAQHYYTSNGPALLPVCSSRLLHNCSTFLYWSCC